MYRKIALITIAIFIKKFGNVIQALLVLLMLVFFLLITLKKKPFSTKKLNDMELLSIVTSLISVYCALYFIQDVSESESEVKKDTDTSITLSEPIKLLFFMIILISNMAFFVYWIISMYFELKV